MPLPIEADSRVSEELSELIDKLHNDPDIEEPLTLGAVRETLQQSLLAEEIEESRGRFGNEQSLVAELDALIEEYGGEASALDFVMAKASEDLSTLIETLLDRTDEDVVLTLGGVRDAVLDGEVERLAGDGLIDTDEDQTLLAEIEALVEHYGTDMPAEDVLRFG